MIIYSTLAGFYHLPARQNRNIAPPIFTIAQFSDQPINPAEGKIYILHTSNVLPIKFKFWPQSQQIMLFMILSGSTLLIAL